MNFERTNQVIDLIDRVLGDDFQLKNRGYLHLDDPEHFEVDIPFKYYERLKTEFQLDILHISCIAFTPSPTVISPTYRDIECELLVTCEADKDGNITYIDTELIEAGDGPTMTKPTKWKSLGDMAKNIKEWCRERSNKIIENHIWNYTFKKTG